jgi:hypothetical protein
VSVPRSLLVNGVTGLGHLLPHSLRKRNRPSILGAKKARSRSSETMKKNDRQRTWNRTYCKPKYVPYYDKIAGIVSLLDT